MFVELNSVLEIISAVRRKNTDNNTYAGSGSEGPLAMGGRLACDDIARQIRSLDSGKSTLSLERSGNPVELAAAMEELAEKESGPGAMAVSNLAVVLRSVAAVLAAVSDRTFALSLSVWDRPDDESPGLVRIEFMLKATGTPGAG